MSVASVARTPEEQENVMTWARNVYVPPRTLVERATGGASARFVKEVAAQMPKLLRPDKVDPNADIKRELIESKRDLNIYKSSGKGKGRGTGRRSRTGAPKENVWKKLAQTIASDRTAKKAARDTAQKRAAALRGRIKAQQRIVDKGRVGKESGKTTRARLKPIKQGIEELNKDLGRLEKEVAATNKNLNRSERAIARSNAFHARSLEAKSVAEKQYWYNQMIKWMDAGNPPDDKDIKRFLVPYGSPGQPTVGTGPTQAELDAATAVL
tara:strand:- start:1246 stop:2049 length:804 start_codon:yes stop_codon:yes gene_type:complete